jgi:hypothetical protein
LGSALPLDGARGREMTLMADASKVGKRGTVVIPAKLRRA